MTPRERLLTALQHREPDRVPFDISSNQVTGIHTVAYRSLRRHLNLSETETVLSDSIQGLAHPGDDFLTLLKADVRGLFPRCSHNWNIREKLIDDYWEYRDEWGIVHHRPKDGGLYYSIVAVPLGQPMLSVTDLRRYRAPDFTNPERIEGLQGMAAQYRSQGYAVMLKDPFAGLFEMGQRLRGMETFLLDMIENRELTEAILDRLVELKLDFWSMALPRLQQNVDIISLSDDYGTQTSQLISPSLFRELIKPRLSVLLGRIRKLAPRSHIFFHSCGNVRPIIPDFIELGVSILNPVHIRATGMEPFALKRDFGKDITFWGGGVDTQSVLPNGTPQEVRDDARRNIDALAPGGGYVFNTVHNIQADVPPQNIHAMWNAWQEFSIY